MHGPPFVEVAIGSNANIQVSADKPSRKVKIMKNNEQTQKEPCRLLIIPILPMGIPDSYY